MFFQNRILLSGLLALAIVLGNLLHSFITTETHVSLSNPATTFEIDHGHSHDWDDPSEGEKSFHHKHNHNPIDHSHDLPMILMKPSDQNIDMTLRENLFGHEIAISRIVAGLDRPPRLFFLI